MHFKTLLIWGRIGSVVRTQAHTAETHGGDERAILPERMGWEKGHFWFLENLNDGEALEWDVWALYNALLVDIEFYCLQTETIYIIPSNQIVSPQQVHVFGLFYEISMALCNTIYAVTHQFRLLESLS